MKTQRKSPRLGWLVGSFCLVWMIAVGCTGALAPENEVPGTGQQDVAGGETTGGETTTTGGDTDGTTTGETGGDGSGDKGMGEIVEAVETNIDGFNLNTIYAYRNPTDAQESYFVVLTDMALTKEELEDDSNCDGTTDDGGSGDPPKFLSIYMGGFVAGTLNDDAFPAEETYTVDETGSIVTTGLTINLTVDAETTELIGTIEFNPAPTKDGEEFEVTIDLTGDFDFYVKAKTTSVAYGCL